MDASPECRVCLVQTQPNNRVQLKCNHVFCSSCVKKYVQILRSYHLLTPQKLFCLQSNCKQELQDGVITKIFPGELGFIYNIIKKRYRQSKDPSIVIFDCKGYITADRKPLIPKNDISKQQHARLTNQLVQKILRNQQTVEYSKTCKNIISFNKNIPRKQKYMQCNVCSCCYCLLCFNLLHQGNCPQLKQSDFAIINKSKDKDNTTNQTPADVSDNYIQRNGILRCLNSKCGVAIAKQQGCFWIKCRCSWQMCYPCKKLWGDCEHFKNYPYKKFVPPPEWMVKALNLY